MYKLLKSKYLKLSLVISFMLLCAIPSMNAQNSEQISSMDFVQIQNNNTAEAMHYYEHNWKVLRKQALEKNYIASYQLLQSEYSEATPFHLILITTYKDKAQFDKREDHFRELIEALGDLNLMNDKKPSEFRKTVFGTDAVHLN